MDFGIAFFKKHHSWFSGIGGIRYCVVNFTVPQKPNCGRTSFCGNVCILRCVYVWMWIYVYVYIWIYTFTYIERVYIYMCRYIYIYIYIKETRMELSVWNQGELWKNNSPSLVGVGYVARQPPGFVHTRVMRWATDKLRQRWPCPPPKLPPSGHPELSLLGSPEDRGSGLGWGPETVLARPRGHVVWQLRCSSGWPRCWPCLRQMKCL